MTDSARPIAGSRTRLRRSLQPGADRIAVHTTSIFNPEARKKINGEVVKCSGAGLDELNAPILTGCTRGLSPEEGGLPPQYHPAGTVIEEIPWTTVEVVTEIPTELTVAMEGRQFMYRAPSGDLYTFNVVAKQGGTRYIEWVNKPPPDPEDAGIEGIVGTVLVSGITAPTGLDFDASGNYYVSFNGDQLRRYNASGAIDWTITLGTSLRDVITDGISVYVLDEATSRIYKRSAGTGASELYSSTSNGYIPPLVGSGEDYGNILALARSTSFSTTFLSYVTDQDYLVRAASSGTFVGYKYFPSSSLIAAGDDDGTYVYVLDSQSGVISQVDAGMTVVQTYRIGAGSDEGLIGAGADGIARDADGRFFIADTANNRINLYDENGNYLTSGPFSTPRQLAIDPANGRAYVAETGSNQIVRLEVGEIEVVELGFEGYTLQEEFIGGSNTSGAIGELGWLFSGNGSYAAQASTATHPGIGRLNTAGTSGNANRLSIGPWLWPQVDVMDFIFSPVPNGTATSVRQGVGFAEQANIAGGSPSNGISVEFDPDVSANLTVNRYAAGVLSQTITATPATPGEFYLARFERGATPDEIVVTIFRLLNKSSVTVTKTGLSTTLGMDAVFFARTKNGTAKVLDAEYWSGKFSGLTRS